MTVRHIFLSSVVFCICFFLRTNVYGQFIDLKLPIVPEQSNHWLGPNESQPTKGRNIYSHLAAGVYVTVGADRGLIYAGLSPNVTHILLLDIDNEVTRFNRINITLLQLADNRGDYLW